MGAKYFEGSPPDLGERYIAGALSFSPILKIGPIPTPGTPGSHALDAPGARLSRLCSKQPGSRVILEQFCVANVTAQSVDRLVAGLVHHLEDRGPPGSCRGKKS
jgi:hypothetical protein